MKNIKHQAGWTMWSMIFTMFVVGFFAYITMQLVPVYSSNSNVKNAMKVSVRDADIRKVTRSRIVKGIKSQLYLDGGSSGINYKESLKITRDRNQLIITIDYERVVPLFADISILVNFRPSLKCSLNGGCTEGKAEKDE
jgi:hypothetical protein